MILIIKETNKRYSLTLRPWEDDHWGIDFFNDAEVNVQELSEVSQKQFNEIVEYWKNEVEWYNTGHYSE